ncbi:hypothetical protein HDU78_006980 [Chytriomyces hyalinus]|nr:hypothetical protein HDU78_006980 [Chytriomyces hyalinus]
MPCTLTRRGYPSFSLSTLPREVIKHVLLYIPIDSLLRDVALSSRLFGEHLMYDPHFAYIHTRTCSNKEEGGFAAFKARVTPQLYKMPFIYLQGTLRYILEEQYDERDIRYPRGPLKDCFGTIVGFVKSRVASASSLFAQVSEFGHPDICIARYDLIEAVERGWKEFVRISVRQGFDVSQYRCHVLEVAIKREDAEMIVILLEDSRLNLTADDYRLLIKLLSHEKTKVTKRLVQVVETLLSDKRVANGEFLKAVLHGDGDSVTMFLANPESDPAVLGNLGVKLALYFNRPDVLEKLLQDVRIFPYSLKDSFLFSKAVGKKEYWSVYQILLKNARMYALSEKDWIEAMCEHNNLEAVFAMISHGQLKSSAGSDLWRKLLTAACNNGAYTIVAYILDMEDPGIDINAVDFDESFFQSVEEKHARVLALFGADKRFQPYDTWNIDGHIDSASRFASSPFAKLIRTDSRFFAPSFLKQLAERAFIDGHIDYMRALLSCPCIQSDLFSQPRIAEFFNLDPDMSTAELMSSIYRLQILHEAIYLEDDDLLAEMLQSNVLPLYHLEELLEFAHSVKSWTILLRCILSIESRDPSTKYYLLLKSVLESPNEPISFENLANLLQWTSHQRLFSVRSYLLFGQVQRICENREKFYAAWEAFAAVEVLRSDNPKIMILDGYYS